MKELIIRLGECSLLAIGASVLFYTLKRRTPFGKLPHIVQQIIIGIAFGLVAIFGTETGVNVNGATINARDAGPLCAGLMFGPYAGIIAGVIGGVERWFATLWGAGAYSRLACTIATIFAGFYSAWMRVKLFDRKRPKAIFGIVAAIVTEAVHLLILFLTHIDDPRQAMSILDVCIVPMMVANALAVGVTMFAIDILSYHFRKGEGRLKSLTEKVQARLLIAFAVCYLLTTFFVYAVQTNSALESCRSQLLTGVDDVVEILDDESEKRAFETADRITEKINVYSASVLKSLIYSTNVAEIDIVGGDGVIVRSTIDGHEGVNINTSKTGKTVFAKVMENGGEPFITDFVKLGLADDADSPEMRYVATVGKSGYICIVGFDREGFRGLMDEKDLAKYISNRHIGAGGFYIIASGDGKILSIPAYVTPESGEDSWSYQSLKSFGLTEDEMNGAGSVVRADRRDGTDYYICYRDTDVYRVVGLIEKDEVFEARDNGTNFNSLMQIIVYAVLYTMTYFMIDAFIIKKLKRVNANLSHITSGKLDERVEEKSTTEFAELSDSINSTVDALKGYIAAESERIKKDLAMATTIQHSALPQNFTSDGKYEIYAKMQPAKEVGGDFYDFYMHDGKLVMLVADVSGKGLPAAMFMMQSKMIIKGLVESGHSIEEAFTLANEQLCENNEAEMFVTSWMGLLDLETGHLDFVNAGHNPPVVKRAGGEFEFLKSPAGFVLAGMEGIKYRSRSLELSKGDMIFLYTDGVTEATSTDKELYGEDRLIRYLNANAERKCEDILKGVKTDIDSFVGDADQFDDITMLAVRYK